MKGARGGLASVRPPNGKCQVVGINGALRGSGVGTGVQRLSGEGAGAVPDCPLAVVTKERSSSPYLLHTRPCLPSATALPSSDLLLVDTVLKAP